MKFTPGEETLSKRILIIDDDLELVELLKEYLGAEGFIIDAVNDGEAGVKAGLSGDYGLLILDVMLPRLGGFDVLRRLREHSRVPVLMLTARGDDVDRIVGLEMGADDYLPKPFNPRELVARIRAIQRRSEVTNPPLSTSGAGIVIIGEVQLEPGSRTVRLDGEVIELTSVEFSLLELLMRHAGQVVSREEILAQVLGRSQTLYDRSVDVHISSLRRKLGSEGATGERIKTIRGNGYQYLLPAEPGEER